MFLVSDSALGFSGFTLPPRKRSRPGGVLMDDRANSPGDDRNHEPARLVAALAQGDRRALAQLYDQLSGPIYSLACRLLGDTAEAQDVVQDIFLQVWRTSSSYDPRRGSVFSWVATLTRNRAIDRLRMRRRRSELLAGAAPDLQPSSPAGESDAAASLWVREKADAVRAALTDIPADQQEAIELAYFGGLTQQEIAARLNEPLGTIKARIRRGLLRLKDRLTSRL
jgi:RNA polymerase sigma-70 factor (ECF subfamily)